MLEFCRRLANRVYQYKFALWLLALIAIAVFISSIFLSQFGHHIFCVEERISRHSQKFYEVQESIFNRLLAEEERKALHQFVETRITDADLQIFDSKLEKSPAASTP